MNQQHRPSRRALVATAAWTAPVVVAASAAPALAASPTLLESTRGDSRIAPAGSFLALFLTDVTVGPRGAPLGPGQLRLTATYAPPFRRHQPPQPGTVVDGWALTSTASDGVTWTYQPAVAGDETVILGGTIWDAVDGAGQSSSFTYTVVFAATGFAPSGFVVAYP